MNIVDATFTPCTQGLHDPTWKFARATVPQLEGHVLKLVDDIGTVGLGYVHAIPAISTHGGGALASLTLLVPMLLKRRVDDIAAIMEEIDATLAFNPTVKAGIDMALHDLLSRRLGIPVHVLLGGRMRDSIAQARILAIKPPKDMASKAAQLAGEGYGQLKLKLSGDTSLDVARLGEVRAAVGPDVKLTIDPNQSYNAKQMMMAFGRMERYDISLIEQPVPASDWHGLALLTRSLPVAIEADETAQTMQDVFRIASDRVADVINLKVTKLGGMRKFVEAVRICEAANIVCRVGAAFGPSLLQAASVQAASVVRAMPFACELSEHLHLRDDPFSGLPVVRGSITVPLTPGFGVDFAA